MQDARRHRTILRLLCALVLALAGIGQAFAADPCAPTAPATTWGQRVAAAACAEHRLWYSPFLDGAGRLASTTVSEAENSKLQDRTTPAWRRVVDYWKSTGLLWSMGARPGANECSTAAIDQWPGSAACRAFVIDTPWSAAFISWVMQRAGVPGFRASAGHFDYVRAARRDPAGSPYLLLDPDTQAPAAGDLLCYVRLPRTYGFAGLLAAIDGGATGLNMHCDVVAAAGAGNAYLVGGNVQQAVTMRVLALNAAGRFWNLPRRTDGDVDCSPDTVAACDFNRQDWAALLRLKPQAELARLGPVAPPSFLPPAAAPQACCVNCVVGGGVPRCPASGLPPPAAPPDED